MEIQYKYKVLMHGRSIVDHCKLENGFYIPDIPQLFKMEDTIDSLINDCELAKKSII